MSFKDFTIDSIKYSFQEKTIFLIFGLLLVVLAFLPVAEIMSFEVSFIVKNIPLVLITAILLLIQGGYLSKMLEDFVNGSDIIPTPKFSELTLYLKEGAKDIVLGVFYMLPIFIVVYIPKSIQSMFGDLYYVVFFLGVILQYFFLLIIQTAILYTVLEDYKTAYNIFYIAKKSIKIGFKRLHLVLILSILIFVVMSSVIVTHSNPIMTAIVVIIGFFLYPILAIMDLRYLGLIGREIKNKK